MSVSVALCTYNGAAHIEEQLLSILNQSHVPDEIVVSDDASSDDVLDIVERVFNAWKSAQPGRVPALQILRNAKPLGVTANFAQAIAAGSGNIVILSDQDDVWHPRKVERMLEQFAAHPTALLAFTDARMVGASGDDLGINLFQTLGIGAATRAQLQSDRAFEALLRRNLVTGATVAFRRELAESAAPFPAAWVHDEWLAVTAAVFGPLLMLEETLIDYRQHGGNQIGASALTPQSAVQRLRTPRTPRNRRLLARAKALAERLPQLSPSVSTEYLRLTQEKLAHEVARSAYPAARILRVVPILRRWRSGGYRRFGMGAQDVLRDLVQPE